MADFSELCPLFSTGVYHELFLGRFTASVYTSATYNFMSSIGDPATAPCKFVFGRTVVVTEFWYRRKGAITTDTVVLTVGRRASSGTATISAFGMISVSEDVSTYPDIEGAWRLLSLTACMTLNSTDTIHIGSIGVATDASYDFMVKYREK